MGPFIFVNGNRVDYWVKEASVHEFGHTIQSLMCGPLYFFIIGFPSMIWCNTKKFSDMRRRGEANYYDLYCERGANTLGFMVTKGPKVLREHSYDELIRNGLV